MKAKVLKTFKDKNTKEIHKAGEFIEVTEERLIEINSSKHGRLAEKVAENKRLKK